MSKHDSAGVVAFIEQHLASFSLEALKNAIKYEAKDLQQRLVTQFKGRRADIS